MPKITHFHRKFWYEKLGSQKQKYFLHLWFPVPPVELNMGRSEVCCLPELVLVVGV